MSNYSILLGEGVSEIWSDLIKKAKNTRLSASEKELYRKLKKALQCLSDDPQYPGLKTHEIKPLSKKYSVKIWQSYLENKKSGARRLFWIYGPDKGEITIVGLEQHPPNSSKGYKNIKLLF